MGITCKQVYQAVFQVALEVMIKQPGNEASYDRFMIEGFMTCGVQQVMQDCFVLAGQQLYVLITDFIPKLKSRQAGAGGGADSRGAAVTGKKRKKK